MIRHLRPVDHQGTVAVDDDFSFQHPSQDDELMRAPTTTNASRRAPDRPAAITRLFIVIT
jgi:hypothetical protein